MKKISILVIGLLLSAALGACAYSGVAASGDKVVITRNDLFLFGALRKVYVCQITDNGVSNCQANESP